MPLEIDQIKYAVKLDLVKELCKRAAQGDMLCLEFIAGCIRSKDAYEWLLNDGRHPSRR